MTVEVAGNQGTKDSLKKDYVVRFNTGQRIEHIALIITFVALSVTGIAQRYYTAGWAEWVILGMGGIEYARLIHRIFALVFTIQALYHIVHAAYSYFLKHKALTMVPSLKDFIDVIGSMKYAFGLADKPPEYGRFDYRQKFEYWGLIFGSVILIGTGFILAFPVAVTTILPGQVVAAAVEFHGYEATMAVLTIVIWHLYDVIFRPGIFPADTTIFTGKLSIERMIEEHSLEYAEWENALSDSSADAPSPGENEADATSQ